MPALGPFMDSVDRIDLDAIREQASMIAAQALEFHREHGAKSRTELARLYPALRG